MTLTFTGLCLVLASMPAGPAPSVSAAAQADGLAAESLRLSANSMVYARPDTPGRAGRLIALARFSDALAPGHPQTSLLLAGIYESQARLKDASEAVGRYLRSFPGDYARQVRRLHLAAAALQTAAEREALFQAVAAKKDLPGPVRAEAAANRAKILFGKGEKDQAREACQIALRHDPWHPGALQGAASLKEDAGPVDHVRGLLKMLRGNPTDSHTARQVGLLLGPLGVYDQALRFLNHGAFLVGPRSGDRKIDHEFLVLGLSAALDAGQAPQAIAAFLPKLQVFRDSPNLHSMLIEAHRTTGQEEKAKELTRALESIYRRLQMMGAPPGTLARELAWFYTETRPDPQTALEYVRRAEKADANDPIVQRLVGIAELKTDSVAKGEARLRKLAATDVYAAVYLAEHCIAAGRRDEAAKVILAAGSLARDGPAFRRLNALAARHGVTIPPAEGAAKARKAAEDFPDACLDLARTPEKFLAVAIKAVRDKVSVGEDIEVRATLTNTGEVDIPLGAWGLGEPVLALHVVAAVGGRSLGFTDLPTIAFPAPRYLKKGQSVSAGAVLNVGALQSALVSNPLEDLTLTVGGTLAPIQRGRKLYSALPGVKLSDAVIVRVGLLGKFDRATEAAWAKQYQLALGRIVFDMQRGKLPARLRAARQVAALLCLARLIERGRGSAPAPLARKVTKGVLLRMMIEVLKDESEVVQAEMLAAMGRVDLDAGIVNLLAPTIENKSPLVRFRLVELLGASGLRGQKDMLKLLAKDGGEMVQLMADAFVPP